MSVIKRVAFLSALAIFMAGFFYAVYEPIISNAASSQSVNFPVSLGVSQEVTASSPSTVVMNPDTIGGVVGNPGAPATGFTSFTVKSNDPAGYSLAIGSGQQNALHRDAANYFSDYLPLATSGGTPNYNWSDGAPSAGNAYFGFSLYPAASLQAPMFLNNGSVCNAGTSSDQGHCWFGLNNSPVTVLNSSFPTPQAGEVQRFNFNAESNGKLLAPGTYNASIIITVTNN